MEAALLPRLMVTETGTEIMVKITVPMPELMHTVISTVRDLDLGITGEENVTVRGGVIQERMSSKYQNVHGHEIKNAINAGCVADTRSV